MTTCNKCNSQIDNLDIYCSKCGTLSHVAKENAKDKIFIPIDKIIPYGALLIACGILINIIGFFATQRIIPIIFGIGFAITVAGILLTAMYKKSNESGRRHAAALKCDIEEDKCRFCHNNLKSNSKYCSLCGSKVRP